MQKYVKTTVNIPLGIKTQVNKLIEKGKIKSFSQAINISLNDLIKKDHRSLFEDGMMTASHDNVFMKRTLETQKEFDKIEQSDIDTW